MTYHHLSREERYQISALLKEGLPEAQIALNLGRHKSTINREILRNMGFRGYRPKQADHLATVRSEGCRNAPRISAQVWIDVEKQLEKQFSPEQIAASVDISHETIYRHIYADKAAGGDLWRHLRCQKKRRKRYGGGRDRRGQIADRRPISERPAYVEKRRQVGHWEGDTIIGANHKQAIVSLVERKTGYAILVKVSQKTSDLVSSAIIRRLEGARQRVQVNNFPG
jgi:IS30 family transposase